MTRSMPDPDRWLQPGAEPALADLIDDPIAALLRRRDGLAAADVWASLPPGPAPRDPAVRGKRVA